MKRSVMVRRVLLSTAAALTVAVTMFVGLLGVLDAGYLRGPLLRFLAEQAGRPIQIHGSLETHFLSLHPRVVAAGVTVGNPPWTRPGVSAQFEKISFVMRWRRPGSWFEILSLDVDGANLALVRDAKGYANWQTTDPDKGSGAGAPIMRSLRIRGTRATLDDALRHLRFNGSIAAEDLQRDAKAPLLRITGNGELNGKVAVFEVIGDALATVSHQQSYGFKFSERSSGSVLSGSGELLRAFDFDAIDAKFTGTGDDLLDLYYLTGVTLINTGAYHLSGRVSRRGTHTRFTELSVTSGHSDVLADVSIESSGSRPRFTAEFTSHLVRLSDLGARAAGREQDPEAGKLLLSNAMFNPSAVRRGDWVASFHARRVEVGRMPLEDVSAHVTIDRGVFAVTPLSGEVLGGKLIGRLSVDAKSDDPVSDVDIKLIDAKLGQYEGKDDRPSPVEGSLQARVRVTGRGRSIHQVAASASGAATAVLTHGAIRSSLAELTGIDLRGLGLVLANNRSETGVRCAVGSFQARDGILAARTLVMDTDPLLISGDGSLNLDSESLDFVLRGRPKEFRLRLRAPIRVRGTLIHPTFGVEPGKSVAQSAEAVALGVALTPLAAVLAFVDEGLAKNADCAALEAQAAVATR